MFFRWVLRLFRGKGLDEILADFERTQKELTVFNDRTTRHIESNDKAMEALQAQQAALHIEVERARMVRENLHTMLTQLIVPPPEQPQQENV